MSKHVVLPRGGRRRFSPLVIAAGVAAAVALSMSFSGTLSAFTTSFLHPTNTVSTASATIIETTSDGATQKCTGSNGTMTCTDTNLYGGGTLRPGESAETSVTFKNTGTTTPAHFTMGFGACATTPSGGVDLCDKVVVSLTRDSQALLGNSMTPKLLAGTSPELGNPPAGGASQTLKVKVTLPADAANDTSGLSLSQPITWTFTA